MSMRRTRTRTHARSWASAPILAALLVVTLLLAVPEPVPSSAAEPGQGWCAGNRLANPAFDGGSRKTEGLGTSLSSAVSDGWFPWFVRGSENVNREPEFKVEQLAIGGDPYRVRSGGQSMKWFTTWATHDAGIYQRVAAWSGAQATFTGHGMIYSGEDDGWNGDLKTFLSDPARPGNYRLYVGIDPTGAVPQGMGAAPPASVVWSAPYMTPDQWVPATVSTVARASAITVYIRGTPEFSVKHNDSFWDDTCLTIAGGAPSGEVKKVRKKPLTPAQPGTAPHLRIRGAIPR